MTALVWGLGERKHQLAGTEKKRDRHLLGRRVQEKEFFFPHTC